MTSSNDVSMNIAVLGLLFAGLFRAAPLLNKILSSLHLINLSKNSVGLIGQELHELELNPALCFGHIERMNFNSNLEVENISFRYGDRDEFCLREVSARLEKGKFYGLTGRTGSGKTTFLMLLLAC